MSRAEPVAFNSARHFGGKRLGRLRELTDRGPSSEAMPQTLLNLMGRAIEHEKDALERLISVRFF